MYPYWPVRTGLKIDWLNAYCNCIENLPHIGCQGSHLTTCYYHQDLYWCIIQIRSLFEFFISIVKKWFDIHHTSLHVKTERENDNNCSCSNSRLYVCTLSAPLIFKAIAFARWVVTHSLADSYFHGHCPGVFIQQHFLWYLIMSVQWGTFKTLLSIHLASPILLTKRGPQIEKSIDCSKMSVIVIGKQKLFLTSTPI